MYFDVATKTFKEGLLNADKPAFVAIDKELTWRQLKELSDTICDTLQKAKIPEGHPVLIYGDKEAFFLAAILSCYRKNLPFIPLSPDLPEKRIEKIIAQTKSEAVLVCGNYEKVPCLPVCIKSDLSIKQNASATFKEKLPHTAYIIFTSGSSGQPKGVVISDANIQAFTKWFAENFPVNENTVFINQASFLFDIALADLFGALQTGGSAIFNTNKTVSDHLFSERIKQCKGNYWNSTPSFVSLMLTDKDFNAQILPSIKQFVLSGEELSPLLVKALRTRFPGVKIINAYGPTETCIFASFAEIEHTMLNEPILPISEFPAPNISLEAEEIIISGPTVGKGYLNEQSLTKKKFVNATFRTGDLAYSRNGYLYYKGRADEQIKFNGYRIELNEIKTALENFEFITQAECLPLELNGKIVRLLVFVTSKPGLEEKINGLKKELTEVLPAYMVPSEIILLKEFPHTTSFKVDKKKLLSAYLSTN